MVQPPLDEERQESSTKIPYTLTERDVGQYHEVGYHLYKHKLFSSEKFNRLHSIFEEHLAAKSADKLSDEVWLCFHLFYFIWISLWVYPFSFFLFLFVPAVCV
jgi:hypothetical protein